MFFLHSGGPIRARIAPRPSPPELERGEKLCAADQQLHNFVTTARRRCGTTNRICITCAVTICKFYNNARVLLARAVSGRMSRPASRVTLGADKLYATSFLISTSEIVLEESRWKCVNIHVQTKLSIKGRWARSAMPLPCISGYRQEYHHI